MSRTGKPMPVTVQLDTRVLDRMRAEAEMKVSTACGEAAAAAVEDMRAHWSGHYPPASSAGQPPAVRSGHLDASIELIPDGRTGRIIHVKAAYASYLEYGTSRMAARPFMRPALMRARRTFGSRFKPVITP